MTQIGLPETSPSAGVYTRTGYTAISSIDVVVGGQFGSEAKGHVTQQVIARRLLESDPVANPDRHPPSTVLNIRVAGPNAGHTVYVPSEIDNGMQKFAFRQLPVGIVMDNVRVHCAIAAGSEIDPNVLLSEIQDVKDAGMWDTRPGRVLIVDPEATLLNPADIVSEDEAGIVNRIGSTGKGIGSARSRRIMRTAKRVRDDEEFMNELKRHGVLVSPVQSLYTSVLSWNANMNVVIEGTQGYGLGLHAGFYPQCTSSNCTAADFLAMCQLSPWMVPQDRFNVYVTVRPYPIRVAGNSGPLANETTWEELGLPQERTTVTQKVRRVGYWDPMLAKRAVMANGGGVYSTLQTVHLALTMADQLDPEVAGTQDRSVVLKSKILDDFLEQIQAQTQCIVRLVTTGPWTRVWL